MEHNPYTAIPPARFYEVFISKNGGYGRPFLKVVNFECK